MQRLLATALAATLALGTLAAPALADGHGHGHGHDRAAAHRASSHESHRQDRNGDAYGDEDGRGPHDCVNPAGNVRGWCKHGTAGNGSYNNGYPSNGSGGYANQQISGLVTAVSGNRVTILVGLRSVNVDTSQAYRNGRTVNLGIGSSITAYGYYGNDNTFYATRIN